MKMKRKAKKRPRVWKLPKGFKSDFAATWTAEVARYKRGDVVRKGRIRMRCIGATLKGSP